MYFRVLSASSRTVPGPLRTKKLPSGVFSRPFHLRKTGSGLRWRVTTQTNFPSTDLHAPIDARPGSIVKTVAHDLREMEPELVVALEPSNAMPEMERSSPTPNNTSPPSAFKKAAIVLRVAWVTPTSSLRFSLMLCQRVALNANVFD